MKTAEKVGIRQFRANLKKYLESGEPLVITKGYQKVAVLLPTSLGAWASEKEKQGACSRMKQMLRDQVTPALEGY